MDGAQVLLYGHGQVAVAERFELVVERVEAAGGPDDWVDLHAVSDDGRTARLRVRESLIVGVTEPFRAPFHGLPVMKGTRPLPIRRDGDLPSPAEVVQSFLEERS